jgi:hypothetical protein
MDLTHLFLGLVVLTAMIVTALVVVYGATRRRR